SALAWVLLLIIAAFTALAFFTSKYWVHYDNDRD
ncbi:MAG: ABC transporter permease, partial [Pannonibacter indicus]